MTSILYNDLKTLISASELVPEEQYCITDYVTTVSKANYTSAEYKFDIVVTALDTNTLYEYALLTANSTETYFDTEALLIFNIRYNVNNVIPGYDNDWVDANGKGCIYYMVDNKGNEAPFDFKNIKYNGKFLFNNTLDGTDTSQTVSEYNVVKEVIEDGYFKLPQVSFNDECNNVNIGTNADQLIITESSNLQIGDNCENSEFTNVNDTLIGNEVSDATLTSIDGAEIGDNNNNIIATNHTNLIIKDKNTTITLGGGSNGVIIDSNNTDVTIGTNAKDVYINGSKTIDLGNNIEQFNISSSYNMTVDDDCKLFNLNETNHLTATTGCENINTIKNDYITLTEEVKNVTISDRLTNLILDGTKLTGSDTKLIIQQDEKVVIVNEQTNSEVVLTEDGTTTSNPTSFINDSPSDGFIYGRKDGDWEQIDASGFITDAPSDNKTYGRLNGDWTQINTSGGGGTLSITWSNLKSLRDAGTLVSGQLYRITDYTTTTVQADTQSAGHDFDIIVETLDETTLSEDAKCVRKAGDTYFVNANLEAWEIKYCIDNDTSRFAWANATSGKGVIYYMKDEYNNECPYDFKNIQFLNENDVYVFTFGGTTDNSLTGNSIGNTIKESTLSNKLSLNFNTFGTNCNFNILGFNNIKNTFGDYCTNNNFGNECQSNTFGYDCYSNKFGYSCRFNTFGNEFGLNKLGDSCWHNTFGDGCYNNTFGNEFISNTFGGDCYANKFGGNCSSNIFDDYCIYNTFGDMCSSNNFGAGCGFNMFGNGCSNSTFGDECTANTFGDYCGNNTFGSECRNNNFGNNYYSNTLGSECYSNTFGDNCNSNTFGNSCGFNNFGTYCWHNTFNNYFDSITFGSNCNYNNFYHGISGIIKKDYIKYIVLEDGCRYNNFYSTLTTSGGAYLQRIRIKGLTNATATPIQIALTDANANYEWVIAKNSDGTIEQYCPEDHYLTEGQKTKLAGIAAGAEVNVNADWNATTGDAQILNKPNTLTGYGITDVPSDDKTYGRKNGNWSEIDTSGGGGGSTISITWSALRTLRTAGTLVPGQSYRITDYVCTTTTTDSQAVNNLFDIVVTALDEGHLSENASATYHEGDTYFSSNNSILESWELKYCLDNDVDRFEWPDAVNGKGVIYYMKDDWNNECPYDFKNIQYLKNSVWVYTFGGTLDDSLTGNSVGNTIKELISSTKLSLNYNTFGDNCNFNTFGNTCNYNTFGNNCVSNMFGDNCYSNTFGDSCNSNTFGDDCNFNTFGDLCSSNNFGDYCGSNTFGNTCNYNTFGNNCRSNTFDGSCDYNNFGNYCGSNTFDGRCVSNTFDSNCASNNFGYFCYFNTFGDSCGYNNFGNYCGSNTFANRCSSNNFYQGAYDEIPLNYIRYIVLEDGCLYNNFYSTLTIDDGSNLQRIRIKGLEHSEPTNIQITLSAVNTKYEWVIAKNSSGVIKQYCPEDLV